VRCKIDFIKDSIPGSHKKMAFIHGVIFSICRGNLKRTMKNKGGNIAVSDTSSLFKCGIHQWIKSFTGPHDVFLEILSQILLLGISQYNQVNNED
jgi:hypothetical protein